MSSNILKADNGVSSGTTGLVYTAGNDGTLQLATTTSGGTATTAITIDNSQNVGVGSTPSAWSSIFKTIDIGGNVASFGGTSGGSYMLYNAYYNASQYIYKTSNYASYYANELGLHKWYTAPSGTINTAITFTQVMTLDNSGNWGVGTTTPATALQYANYCAIRNANGNASSFGAGGAATLIDFQYQGGVKGSISITSGATAFNTSSDYRLKNTIAPMTGALAKVAALKPVTYKWNIDNSEGEGFIAHELAEVCPHAVTGEKDAVDAEGNPQYQGIDVSFLVATLTAAIQELSAEVTALKAKLGV